MYIWLVNNGAHGSRQGDKLGDQTQMRRVIEGSKWLCNPGQVRPLAVTRTCSAATSTVLDRPLTACWCAASPRPLAPPSGVSIVGPEAAAATEKASCEVQDL
jgi:hypothetical protein